jgi:hypothetical protein
MRSAHCGNVKNSALVIEPAPAPFRQTLRDGLLSGPQAASDRVLIARNAQGDRLAVQVLYGRHHVSV